MFNYLLKNTMVAVKEKVFNKIKMGRTPIFLFLAVVFLLGVSGNTFAVERTWGGGSEAPGTTNNNWSRAVHWTGDTVPGAAADVIFDSGTSNANCTIDAVVNTSGWITTRNNYAGTITQSQNVTCGDLDILAGTWTMGASKQIDCTQFKVGATFNCGTLSLIKVENLIRWEDATFNASTGTIEWDGPDNDKIEPYFSTTGTITLNNLTITGAGELWFPYWDEGDNLVIGGNLLMDTTATSFYIDRSGFTVQGTTTINGGTIKFWKSDISFQDNLTLASGTTMQLHGEYANPLTMSITSGKTFTNNGTVQITNSNNTINLQGSGGQFIFTGTDIDYNALAITLANVDYQTDTIIGASETVTIGDANCEFDAVTVNAGTLSDTGNYNFTVSGNWEVSGTGTFYPGFGTATLSGAGKTIITSSSNGDDFWHLTITGSYTLEDPLSAVGNLIVSGGGSLDAKTGENNKLTIDGDIEFNNNGTFYARAGTVEWKGTVDRHVWPHVTQSEFYNFVLSATAILHLEQNDMVITGTYSQTGAGTFELKKNLRVDGAMTISAGDIELHPSDQAVTLSIDTSITTSVSGVIDVDWSDIGNAATIDGITGDETISGNDFDIGTNGQVLWLSDIDCQIPTVALGSNEHIRLSGDCTFDAITLNGDANTEFTTNGNKATCSGGMLTNTFGVVTISDGGEIDATGQNVSTAANGTITLAGASTLKAVNITNVGTINLDHNSNEINITGNIDNDGTIDATGTSANIYLEGNWDNTGGTFTCGSSTVTFDGITSLTSSSNSFNNVQLGTATAGGSLTLSDQADINGTFSVLNGGATTLNLTNQTLLFGGTTFNLTNLDTFTITGSTVNFDANAAQTVTSSTTDTYNAITVTNSHADGVTFADDFTTATLSDTTANSKITFNAGDTYTITGAAGLNLDGGPTAGSEITIVSDLAGTQFIFNVTGGAQDVSYVNVKDSAASGSNITANTSINSGGNDDGTGIPQWIFGNVIRYWIAAGNSDWNTDANWASTSGGAGPADYPGAGDTAIFDNGSDFNCTLDAVVSIEVLNVQAGYDGIISCGTNNFTTSGSMTLSSGTYTVGANTTQVDGTLTVSGGTGTFTSGIIDANGAVSITSGTLTAPSGSFDVAGNWEVSATGILTPATGTVTLSGTTKTITTTSSNADAFYDLVVSGTYITASSIDIGRHLQITGTLDGADDIIALTGDGNFDLDGTFTCNTSTVKLQGTGEIQGTPTFYKLECGATGEITTIQVAPVPNWEAITITHTLTVGGGKVYCTGNQKITLTGTALIANFAAPGQIEITELSFAGGTNDMGGGDYTTSRIQPEGGAAVTLTGNVAHSGEWAIGHWGSETTTTTVNLNNYNVTSSHDFNIGHDSGTNRVGQVTCGSGNIEAVNLYIQDREYGVGHHCSVDLGTGTHVFTGNIDVKINGILTLSSGTTTVGGNFTGNGTVTHNSGTLIFNGTASLTSGGNSLNNVQLGTATAGGSLTLLDQDDINGTFSVLNGAATTLNLTNQTLLSGGATFNLTNLDTLTESGSTVNFDSTTAGQTVTSISETYNIITVSNTHANGVIFADAFTTVTFNNTTGSSKLTFNDGDTYTITGVAGLNLDGGAAGTRITLISGLAGTQFIFNVTGGAQAVSYVNVKDSAATGSSITANNSINSGGNDDSGPIPHWIFPTTLSVTLCDAGDTGDYTTWAIGSGKTVDTVYLMDISNCVLVKNDGNVAEDFSIEGAGTNWTLASTNAENQCVLMGLFNGASAPVAGDFSTTYDIIDGTTRWATTSAGNGIYEGANDGDNVAANSGEKLYIYLETPSSVTSGLQETITVTIGCREHP